MRQHQILDGSSIKLIQEVFNISESEIADAFILKKGMTNRSFVFSVHGEKYIIRIPGEGTEMLISRKNEATVYSAIKEKGLCDDPVYLSPETGIMITKFLHNARVCNPNDSGDVMRCMKRLKGFHDMALSVGHEFDVFSQIEFYESLWKGKPSVYTDYEVTKKRVLSLRKFVEQAQAKKVLAHIDAVPDNFLFFTNDSRDIQKNKESAPEVGIVMGGGIGNLYLTDWEYAGMQDPHLDIAMFSVYSFYNRQQIDNLISLYFNDEEYSRQTKAKIYCYVAMGGLLWSNWCEFKSHLGVEFGEYGMRQYGYAKEFYHVAMEEIKILGRR